MEEKNNKDNRKLILQYAGLGTQFIVAIGLGIFGGIKLDEYLGFSMPVFVWVFPLLIIIGIIVKIIIDTSRK